MFTYTEMQNDIWTKIGDNVDREMLVKLILDRESVQYDMGRGSDMFPSSLHTVTNILPDPLFR